MNSEIKKIIVMAIGGAFIGIILGQFGLIITDPMWWIIDLPLVAILAFTHTKIWDSFASISSIFSKTKKYI